MDASTAELSREILRIGSEAEQVFVVETEFTMQDLGERLRGFFLLLPDPASLQAILRTIRLA